MATLLGKFFNRGKKDDNLSRAEKQTFLTLQTKVKEAHKTAEAEVKETESESLLMKATILKYFVLFNQH